MNWILAISFVVLIQLEICQGCSLVKEEPTYGPVKIMKEAENVLLATFLFNTSNIELNLGEFEVHCVFKSSIAVEEIRNASPIGILGIVAMDSCKGSMQMVENGTYIIALNTNDCPVGSHNEHCFSLAEITLLQKAVFLPTADNLQTAANICGFPNVTAVTLDDTCPKRNVTTETCIVADNGAGNVDTFATLILAMILICLGMM